MKRQLIAGVCALLIMPGVFFYQPSDTAQASQGNTSVHMRVVLQEESEGEHKDVPWIPILIGALVVPTAVLVIPSFFMGKRKAEDDDTGPRG